MERLAVGSGTQRLQMSFTTPTLPKPRGLLVPKGRGVAAYYGPGPVFVENNSPQLEMSHEMSQGEVVKAHGRSVKAQGRSVKAHGRPVKVHGEEALLNANQFADMLETAPQDLQERIQRLGKRERNAQAIPVLIYDLCAWRPMSREVLCRALGRSAHFVRRLMTAMVGKHLDYVIPDMVRHPRQAYKAIPGHRPDPPAS